MNISGTWNVVSMTWTSWVQTPLRCIVCLSKLDLNQKYICYIVAMKYWICFIQYIFRDDWETVQVLYKSLLSILNLFYTLYMVKDAQHEMYFSLQTRLRTMENMVMWLQNSNMWLEQMLEHGYDLMVHGQCMVHKAREHTYLNITSCMSVSTMPTLCRKRLRTFDCNWVGLLSSFSAPYSEKLRWIWRKKKMHMKP